MRATVVITGDEERVRAWLAELYDGEEAGDPPPDPFEWFRVRVRELVEDEYAVALMMGPLEAELDEVDR